MPFFIDYSNNGNREERWWAVYERVGPASAPSRFTELAISGSQGEHRAWLGPHDLPLRFVCGERGIVEAQIATARGEAVIALTIADAQLAGRAVVEPGMRQRRTALAVAAVAAAVAVAFAVLAVTGRVGHSPSAARPRGDPCRLASSAAASRGCQGGTMQQILGSLRVRVRCTDRRSPSPCVVGSLVRFVPHSVCWRGQGRWRCGVIGEVTAHAQERSPFHAANRA